MTSVTIFAKKDYVSSDGTVPLYLRLTIDRKVYPPLKLGKRTRPEHWDDHRARVNDRHPNFVKLNQLLDQLQRRADDVLLDHEISGRVLSYETFRREFSGLSPYDFYYAADRYIESMIGKKKSFLYLRKVKSVVAILKIYAPVLNLNQVDYAFIDKYMAYLRGDHLVTGTEEGETKTLKGNKTNSVITAMKILRRICTYAIKIKILKANPFEDVELKYLKTEKDYLTLDEFKRYEELLDANLPYYLRKTLVWFLLACCTGRRWKDLESFYSWEFHKEHIKILQTKRISSRQGNKEIVLFLNDRIRRLVAIILDEKLPVITPAARGFLKQLSEMIGVKKTIGFHSGRHTFAGINKELTEDITVRKDLLGHDSVSSTLIYDHSNPTKLKAVMEKWDAL